MRGKVRGVRVEKSLKELKEKVREVLKGFPVGNFLFLSLLLVLSFFQDSFGALSGGEAMKEIGSEAEQVVQSSSTLLKIGVLAFYLLEFLGSIKVARDQYNTAVQQGRAQEGGMWKVFYYAGGVILGVLLVAISSKLVVYVTGTDAYGFQSLFGSFLGK